MPTAQTIQHRRVFHLHRLHEILDRGEDRLASGPPAAALPANSGGRASGWSRWPAGADGQAEDSRAGSTRSGKSYLRRPLARAGDEQQAAMEEQLLHRGLDQRGAAPDGAAGPTVRVPSASELSGPRSRTSSSTRPANDFSRGVSRPDQRLDSRVRPSIAVSRWGQASSAKATRMPVEKADDVRTRFESRRGRESAFAVQMPHEIPPRGNRPPGGEGSDRAFARTR